MRENHSKGANTKHSANQLQVETLRMIISQSSSQLRIYFSAHIFTLSPPILHMSNCQLLSNSSRYLSSMMTMGI